MVDNKFSKVAGIVFSLAVIGVVPGVQASSGDAILEQRCVQCHELTGPGPTTLAGLWAQKGPNFSYAGNKYKQAWLEEWLTKPKRIRPAGMFYGNHIKPGEAEDVIDESTLVKHVALDASEAKAVAVALMQRKAKTALIKPGAYKPGKISLSSGEMLFIKFRGCASCHQIEPGYGGLSGPEVYTVARRLQEDYIISFIQDPQAWSPLSFMPKRHLKEKDLQKFVHYFRALAEEDFQ